MMLQRIVGYPIRSLCLWVLVLSFCWLAFCSPWSQALNLSLGALAILVAGITVIMSGRRQNTRRLTTQRTLADVERTLDSFPTDLRHNIPLVLVIGPEKTLAATFGKQLVRLGDAALWVSARNPSHLPHLADALRYWRQGQGPEAVACLMDPNDHGPDNSLVATLQSWRSAIGQTSRSLGYRLPVCVAGYLPSDNHTGEKSQHWIGVIQTNGLSFDALPVQMAALSDRQMQTLRLGSEEECMRARIAARLDTLMSWVSSTSLPLLTKRQNSGAPQVHLHAFGVTIIKGSISAHTLFADHLATRSGLVPLQRAEVEPGGLRPLPDVLLQELPLRRAIPPLLRAASHALVCLIVFFCCAAAASAWQNQTLVQRLFKHIDRYEAIDSSRHAERAHALMLLKQDRDDLENYIRVDVPFRLSLGFYQGDRWLPRINALITGYHAPEPPPAMLELDSMSLFNSGSAILNPGSNRVLVRALEMIKSHPDKRVLIAGHTDSAGNPQSNLRLSQDRAASVRDWLIDASSLPATNFAIQAYGDTRPKTANDTETGRAANRRVEITLVPDCRGRRITEGQPACSFN